MMLVYWVMISSNLVIIRFFLRRCQLMLCISAGDNKVLSQEISTRVVHLHPSKKNYLNLSTIHGRSLDNLNFDFSTL